MTGKQENYMRMSGSSFALVDENTDIVSTNPAFVTAIEEAKAKAMTIKAIDAKKVNRKGITIDKNDSKNVLIERTAILSGLLSAYAVTTGNDTLDTEIRYTESALRKLREESMLVRCQAIHDKAFEIKTEVAEYGVTPEMVIGVQEAIDDFSIAAVKPRVAAGKSKTATADLVEEFKDLNEIFTKRLDPLSKSFKTTHPEFYETWKNLREIPDSPTTQTQLKGIITDQTTNAPISGATVTATATPETANNLSTPATGDPVSTKTDAKGEYLFKPLPFGDYEITITAAGYEEFKQEIFDVVMGDINHLDAALKQQA